MTQPIQEPTLSRTDSRLTWGQNQLFRRPAPISAAGTISMAQWAVDNFSLGSPGANINWATLDSTFDATGYFDITGGSDIQVNDHGIYGLHFKWRGIAASSTLSSYLSVFADVISGSNGLWSSQAAGDDFDGVMPIITIDGNMTDIDQSGSATIPAYVAWAPTDTFPVVIQIYAQYAEDNVGVGKSPDFRCTMVRFGDGDVGGS